MLLSAFLLTPGLAAGSEFPQPESPLARGQPSRILGEVRSPESPPRLLPGARLRFCPDSPQQLALLRGLLPPRLPELTGVTNARGRYSLAGALCPGSLLVEHDSGLGALVLHSAPGTPRIVITQPMAELVLPPLEGTPTTHVQALGPGGRGVFLGLYRGRRLLLPAGSYRLLLGHGTRLAEFRCQLQPGRSQRLAWPEDPVAHALQLWPGFKGRVTLVGWPQVNLPPGAGGRVPIPPGPGPRMLRVLEERQAKKVILVQELWIVEPLTRLEPSTLELRPTRILDRLERPVAEAQVFAYRLPAGGPRLLSISQSDAEGLAQVPSLESQPSAFLVVTRQGFAPLQVQAHDHSGPLHLARGHALSLLVQDPQGEHRADVEVELAWPQSPRLRMCGTTDARGQVSFRDLPPGELECRLIGTPYLETVHLLRLPVQAARRTGSGRPQAIVRARPGYQVRGRVLLPSERPAAGVQVLLRDAQGILLGREKVAVTAADGSFVLHGLPKDLDLLLWATLSRGGQSWISKKQRVEAGSEEWIVQLRPEDPALPGKLR